MVKGIEQQYGDYLKERGVGEVEESKGGINGGGRKLDLGCWAQSSVYRWCVIELYIRNLYNY